MSNKGFTLIEMAMVILLLGILSAIAIPQFINFSSDAKSSVTRERLTALRNAIKGDATVVANGSYTKIGYENHLGKLPTTLDDLITQGKNLSYNPYSKLGWRGPYIDASNPYWNKDAWGSNFQYSLAQKKITSCGSDQSCGTSDDLSINL
ncbi:MAG: prepilin-type N-terminal cleavage/methylation domain-containing protein [Oligoflexia bacterium]|nr:prepilin-type N-terminal cleavage/methylation domain-containing protein [Oligoflexia bacterium]MBF0367198.1 prepilin-type N-terminal cleavage/methylation domain-containing protein [Oligoflexia bacterium]